MISCNQIIDVHGSIFTDCAKVCTGYVSTGLQAGMMEKQHLPPEKIQNMSETGWSRIKLDDFNTLGLVTIGKKLVITFTRPRCFYNFYSPLLTKSKVPGFPIMTDSTFLKVVKKVKGFCLKKCLF